MTQTDLTGKPMNMKDLADQEEMKDIDQETIKSLSDKDFKEKLDTKQWTSVSLTNKNLAETENSLRDT